MGTALSRNSYLLDGRCSARNVVWHYLHDHGPSMSLHSCTDYYDILDSHCCWTDTCTPNGFIDKEFGRYAWVNEQGIPWNGLGNPLGDGVKVQYNWLCLPQFNGGEISEEHAKSPNCTDACLRINLAKTPGPRRCKKTQKVIAVAVTRTESAEEKSLGLCSTPDF